MGAKQTILSTLLLLAVTSNLGQSQMLDQDFGELIFSTDDFFDMPMGIKPPKEFKRREVFNYNISLYSEWSDWSDCEPKKACSQERSRDCVNESFLEYKDKDNTKCPVKKIVETRVCESTEERQLCVDFEEEKRKRWEDFNVKCGLQAKSLMKIAGGSKANVENWPWLLSLVVDANPKTNAHLCGATLISPLYAITAAHCLDGNLLARLPKDEWVSTEDILDGEVKVVTGNGTAIKVQGAIVHPQWNPKKLLSTGYDLAVLKLETPLDSIMPACMGFELDEVDRSKLDCWIVGYGKRPSQNKPRPPMRRPIFDIFDMINIFDDPFIDLHHLGRGRSAVRNSRENSSSRKRRKNTSKELHEAQVPVQSLASCESFFGPLMSDRHICAGGIGKDTCEGDSGGGLYCKKRGDEDDELKKFFLYGVTSFGSIGCSGRKSPRRTVYSSVPGAEKWIKEKLLDDMED
ncbi:hypothetical protein Ciccas_000533 [Cichlidogyrus casuarinus]|uniref:Peptidase S1 domain-containing protein n=1 Tax=Cichlidogyrus casuarinus TaxID=1844966 RepID=A0ABD2QN16_9PLAT